MTRVTSLTTTLSFCGKFKVEGKKGKQELYNMIITDNDFPAVKMYGQHMFDLKTATLHRDEFLSNRNVVMIGFNRQSTTIEKISDNQYQIVSSVQGEPFKSDPCTLDWATCIYDMLVNQRQSVGASK